MRIVRLCIVAIHLIAVGGQYNDKQLEYIASQQSTNKFGSLVLTSSNIRSTGILCLTKGDFSRVTYLNLNQNKIGNRGCQYLTHINCSILQHLSLANNNIYKQGANHLSKGDWKSLKKLVLCDNKIKDIGNLYTSKGNWKRLKQFTMGHGVITFEGTKKYLLYATPDIYRIYLLYCYEIQRYYRTPVKNMLKLWRPICSHYIVDT